jgi:penicillin-binding protein activator
MEEKVMKRNWMRCGSAVAAAAAVMLTLAGCAMFRSSVADVDPAKAKALSAGYDQKDLISWTDEMAKSILGNPFPPEGVEKPIVAPLGIQNRTKTHLDTQALEDTITMKLLESGKAQIVNTARRDDLLKEQGFQLANTTPETRVAIGKQLGAKYMLTGSIIEITDATGRQARMSKKENVFYQLTMEVTDLQTGLLVLRKQASRMRQESKPIIGW